MINIFSLFYTNWAISFTAGHVVGRCDSYCLKLEKGSSNEVCWNSSLMILRQVAAEHTEPHWPCNSSTSAASTGVCSSSQGALVGSCFVPLALGIRVGQQFVPLAAVNCQKSCLV